MVNRPPFATLNHFAADLGIPTSQDHRGLVLDYSPSSAIVFVREYLKDKLGPSKQID